MIINTDKIKDCLNHKTFKFNTTVKVRTQPTIVTASDTGLRYKNGDVVNYENVGVNVQNNYLWLTYTSYQKYKRFVACGEIGTNGAVYWYGKFI